MWKETNGKTTRPIPESWRKEWVFENVYAWIGWNPLRCVNLCVLDHEPNATERAKIERQFRNATPPS